MRIQVPFSTAQISYCSQLRVVWELKHTKKFNESSCIPIGLAELLCAYSVSNHPVLMIITDLQNAHMWVIEHRKIFQIINVPISKAIAIASSFLLHSRWFIVTNKCSHFSCFKYHQNNRVLLYSRDATFNCEESSFENPQFQNMLKGIQHLSCNDELRTQLDIADNDPDVALAIIQSHSASASASTSLSSSKMRMHSE